MIYPGELRTDHYIRRHTQTLMRRSLDVLGHVALNHEFNALNGGAADIRDKWRQQGNDHISSKGFLVGCFYL